MPRLSIIDPAKDSGPGAGMLNGVLKAKQINIFKGMAVNAPVLKAFLGFAGGVKSGGALSAAEHEVVALTVAEKRRCGYCTAAHTMVAAGEGIDEVTATNIRRGVGADGRMQALIDFSIAVLDTDGFVSDEQIQTFRDAGYGDEAIIELIGQITVMTFTNLYNHVNETEVDFPVPAEV